MKGPKPKKVNYSLIEPPTSGQISEPYRLLDIVRRNHHDETHEARIALAWRITTNPDKDGHLVLGKCLKITDLQKEMAEWDFVIVLNKQVWDSLEFTEAMKMALLDHELCHAAVAEDAEGDAKEDERGRPVFRCRKHDIEEFTDVVRRHGCYKRDLERLAQIILEKQRAPLLQKPSLTAQVLDKTAEIINSGALDSKDTKVRATVTHQVLRAALRSR